MLARFPWPAVSTRTHQARQSERSGADAANIELQRRRGGRAVPVFVVQRLLEVFVNGRIEPVEDARIFAAQIQVEPGGLRNRIQARSPAEAHDSARGSRCVMRGMIGQECDRATDGVGRIRDAKRCPGMPTGTEISHAIPPRSQCAVHDALQARPIERDKCVGPDGLPV